MPNSRTYVLALARTGCIDPGATSEHSANLATVDNAGKGAAR